MSQPANPRAREAADASTAGEAIRFDTLDWLRGLAFLAVFGYHYGLPLRPWLAWGGIGYRIIPNLDFGVEIFFVVSGFLIFRPFALANLAGAPRPKLRTYVLRRALRIYPAYWLALSVCLLLGEVHIHGGFSHYAAHYALVHTYLPERLDQVFDGIGPAWSLVVEVSFYVLVPVLAFVLRRFGFRGHVITLLGLTSVGYFLRVFTITHPLNGVWGGYAKSFVGVLPLAIAALGPGMLLAVVSVRRSAAVDRWFARSWPWWCIAAGCVGAMMWLSATGVGFSIRSLTTAQEGWHRVLSPLLATAVVAPAVLKGARRHRAIRFPWRTMSWVGTVSYGAYLWHQPLIEQAAGDHFHIDFATLEHTSRFRSASQGVVVLGLALGLATVSWFGVERPAQNLARRWTQR